MKVEIRFPAYDAQGRAFLTWRPVEVAFRLLAAPPGMVSVDVAVSARTLAGGGSLQFSDQLTHDGADAIALTLPADGQPVTAWISGAFPSASERHGDVVVEVRGGGGNGLLGSHDTMVRVRKDANAMTTRERDRFLAALATLNGAGTGAYRDFRDMHVGGPPDREAHGGPGFLPWHRAYLLDFERSLQALDGEVSLPYWRFDQAAPKVFTRAFMGVPDAAGQVQFAAGNPLSTWVAAGLPGVERGGGVGPQTVPAVRSEAATLRLGGPAANASFGGFRGMQGDPHGSAHMSHISGWITSPWTAPRDPLFFLLHCNVDRLWAKWQWVARRHDPADADAYAQGGFLAGHNLPDRLWPWCGPLAAPRPQTAPGGALAPSPMTASPAPSPRLRDMIDYLGTVSNAHHGFAYDDVPFEM